MDLARVPALAWPAGRLGAFLLEECDEPSQRQPLAISGTRTTLAPLDGCLPDPYVPNVIAVIDDIGNRGTEPEDAHPHLLVGRELLGKMAHAVRSQLAADGVPNMLSQPAGPMEFAEHLHVRGVEATLRLDLLPQPVVVL